MNRDQALAAIDRYEDLVRNFGYPDEEARAAVKSIVWSLERGPNQDPYFLEKVGGMENWAEIGLSTRKFERHGGLENVRSFALSEAQTARSLVERHWPE